jgi:hypothetical protein
LIKNKEKQVIRNIYVKKTIYQRFFLVHILHQPKEKRLERDVICEVNPERSTIKVKRIPNYAWSNGGAGDMTVWMLLGR